MIDAIGLDWSLTVRPYRIVASFCIRCGFDAQAFCHSDDDMPTAEAITEAQFIAHDCKRLEMKEKDGE